MVVRTLCILAALLFCSQLYAVAEIVEQLRGTTYATKTDSDSRLDIRMLYWSDAEEMQAVRSAYNDFLGHHDRRVFADFLNEQEVKGYFLTSERSGYLIRYAWQEMTADGENLVLLITPGLTSKNPNMWREVNRDGPWFTLVEIHIAGDTGLVKTSLDTDIMINGDGRLALQNFAAAAEFGVIDEIVPVMGR